jgi:hypothetical protein
VLKWARPTMLVCFLLLHSSTTMTMMEKGYRIRCASCHREFESKGLRYCSPECERSHRERQENLAAMAEVGTEPPPRRRCANPECRARIPAWRNGRKVSSLTRFCSPKCARKVRAAIDLVLSLKRENTPHEIRLCMSGRRSRDKGSPRPSGCGAPTFWWIARRRAPTFPPACETARGRRG